MKATITTSHPDIRDSHPEIRDSHPEFRDALQNDKVRCPGCKRIQRDAGERATCGRCGFSPLPSRAYPPGHVFRPRTNP